MSWLFYYLELTPLTSSNPQPQRIQLDKAFRILLIIRTLVFFKGRDLLVEQGVFRLPTNNVYVTLVKLQANGAVHVVLGLVDQRLQGFTLRGPPVAVVDHLGVARHQAVFQVGHFTVQGDGLDGAVGTQHDGAARCFIAAAGLHAHVAVLNDVQATDTVLAGQLVQGFQNHVRLHFLTINGNNVALPVGQLNVSRLLWSGFRRNTPAPHVFLGFRPGIFQVHAFVGNVQQVGIHGVRALALLHFHRNVALFAVLQQLLAGVQIPLTPGSNHLHTRLQRIGAQLETHLVVTLTGRTAGNRIGAGFIGNVDQTLGNQRAGNGGTQQVLALVDGVGAEHREHVIAHKLFAQVLDVDFLNAQRFRLGTRR